MVGGPGDVEGGGESKGRKSSEGEGKGKGERERGREVKGVGEVEGDSWGCEIGEERKVEGWTREDRG